MTFSYNDYTSWLKIAVGGGLPQNFLGYIIMKFASLFRCETLDITPYTSTKALAAGWPHSIRTYLSTALPQRSGKRPRLAPWILPQRQIEEPSSDAIRAKFELFITSLAQADPKRLKVGNSRLERIGPALFLDDSVVKHVGAKGTRNEIAHMHGLEGSMHVMLAPADAKAVIETGWGERFGLSGGLLPMGYLILYAPRDEKEWVVVQGILKASVGWMLGAADVEETT